MDLAFGRLAIGGPDAPYTSIGPALMRHDVVIVDFEPSAPAVDHLERAAEALGHGGASVMADARQFARRGRTPEQWPATQSPHTHGWHLDQPPAIIAEFCVSNVEIGGESTFVSARTMLRSLRQRFSAAELRPLWQPDAAEATVDGKTIHRPVFTRLPTTPPRVSCSFSCHEFNRTTPSGMALPAFDFCREFVRLPANQATVKLEPAQCAFVRNSSVLTGRRGWSVDGPGSRRFVHSWIAAADGFAGFSDDE